MSMATHKTTYLPPIRIDKSILEELDTLVKTHGYRSRTELVREAIEEKITQLKGSWIIELRIVQDPEAKQDTFEHIKGKPSVYPSKVADALRLPMEQVFKVVNELLAGQSDRRLSNRRKNYTKPNSLFRNLKF